MTPSCRVKLRPTSPWRTPWRADTLTGMLLTQCARVHGPKVLNTRIINPMLEGAPPFILSDACPGDLLPMPIWLRVAGWSGHSDDKKFKRARWLIPDDFEKTRNNTLPDPSAFIEDNAVYSSITRQHVTLDRITDTTGQAESGLGIFNIPETSLTGVDYFSIYYRTDSREAEELLLDLLYELSLAGFGADTSTGRGQFELFDAPEPCPALDTTPDNANATITLSSFQPAPADPRQGLWEAFSKFGKLGPSLTPANINVAKNAILFFRPGACFLTPDSSPGFLGRAIPMDELLPETTASTLRQQSLNIIHPAFTFTVSAYIHPEIFA